MSDILDLDALTIRQLLQVQIRLLASIAGTLESLEAATAIDAAEDGCPHPEDARISLSSQGDLNHWVCGMCKFDNKHDVMN